MSRHPPFKQVEASRPDFEADYVAHTTKVPNTEFVPGSGLNNLPYSKEFVPGEGEWKSINPEDHEKLNVYKTPRPIAFVSTLSENGQPNLAPMSYFNIASHDPPTIMLSIQTRSKKHPGGLKDTNHNIKMTKEFCVSIISESFLEAANYTAIDAPNEVSEWQMAGLTQRSSETVKPAHVGESAFSMECVLSHWHDIISPDGEPSNTVILGEIKRFHVKDFVLNPEDPMKVLTEKLRPVARLGGITYSRSTQRVLLIRPMMELTRPVWDQVKDTQEVEDALAAPVKTTEAVSTRHKL